MTMRIALVPYEPGQEPEGMVSSLDPEQYDEKGVLDADIDNAETHLTAIAAAVKAAKRDPWAWVKELSAREQAMVEALREITTGCDDSWAVGMAADALEAARGTTNAPVDEPESAEDVPELWVSRDASCPGDWSDLWTKGKPVLDDDGQWLGPLDNSGSYYMPTRLSRALGLGPGDCRRVTRDEFERYFRPVLKLDPSERYAALERMVP